jgi:hypothetical protein
MMYINLWMLLGLFLARSEAWTTTTAKTSSTRRKLVSSFLLVTTNTTPEDSQEDDDDDPVMVVQSLDKIQVITKSNKQLVFDDKAGRFFETSRDPNFAAAATFSQPLSNVPSSGTVKEDELQLFSKGNEMVSTEVLFGRKNSKTGNTSPPTTATSTAIARTKSTEKKFPHMEVVSDILVSDYATRNSKPAQKEAPPVVNKKRIESIVEQSYTAWNQRDMTAVAECFDENRFAYQDTQFLGEINTKPALMQHFQNQANLLPPNSQLILENIAVDASNGNIGAQWHVETTDADGGVASHQVPFTRGCSFYKTNPDNGRIVTGFRASEMVIKPAKSRVNMLVSLLLPMTQSSRSFSARTKPPGGRSSASKRSIIDEYLDAWNRRDIDSALDCFAEDCVYQMEDPVFFGDTLLGKAALREHLEKKAGSLPPTCQILLDNTAVDPMNGNIGTIWHLEVNGIALPNLRGCSMYSTDPATGLLNSGFDVTEAPIKIPRQLLSPTSWLSLPARALFGQ